MKKLVKKRLTGIKSKVHKAGKKRSHLSSLPVMIFVALSAALLFTTAVIKNNESDSLSHAAGLDVTEKQSLSSSPSFRDTTAPEIVMINPTQDGPTLLQGKTIFLHAFATDNVGVTRVAIWVDDVPVCVVTSLPYKCSWVIPAIPNAMHTVKAMAYDAAGNVKTVSTTTQSN